MNYAVYHKEDLNADPTWVTADNGDVQTFESIQEAERFADDLALGTARGGYYYAKEFSDTDAWNADLQRQCKDGLITKAEMHRFMK